VRGGTAAVAAITVLAVAVWLATGAGRRSATPVDAPTAAEVERARPRSADERVVSDATRRQALARARVWPRSRAALAQESFRAATVDEISCRFLVTQLGGTTPKFDCALENGETLRVKYGNAAEIPSEAAATRLVRALGFPADTITLVRRLRCHGCPSDPFTTMKTVGAAHAGSLFAHAVDYGEYRDFDWVAIERKYDGQPIETATQQGWVFHELDQVDASQGGAPRAHVDALRLLAAFLPHWDNKSENQRLVCVSRPWPEDAPCQEPLLVLQDLGAAFGPRKVDLDGWSTTGIWGDRATCRLSMRGLPYDGATFRDVRVGEPGRQLFIRRLHRISPAHAADLFAGARFDQKRGLFSDVRPVDDWVRAFRTRVAMVTDGPPCPAL
jgi:hypothetical protein